MEKGLISAQLLNARRRESKYKIRGEKEVKKDIIEGGGHRNKRRTRGY